MDQDDETAPSGAPSRTERIFIRISILQTVLAATGIFTGAVALYAALTEADAVRKQQQAMVWPELMIGSSFRAEPAAQGDGVVQTYSLAVMNPGIGPARIRGARISVDGEPQTDWNGVLAALGVSPQDYSLDLLAGRTLVSGDRVDVLSIAETGPARELRQEINSNGRLQIETCYCSVFDECWTVQFFAQPEPVDSCPDYGDAAFTQ